MSGLIEVLVPHQLWQNTIAFENVVGQPARVSWKWRNRRPVKKNAAAKSKASCCGFIEQYYQLSLSRNNSPLKDMPWHRPFTRRWCNHCDLCIRFQVMWMTCPPYGSRITFEFSTDKTKFPGWIPREISLLLIVITSTTSMFSSAIHAR